MPIYTHISCVYIHKNIENTGRNRNTCLKHSFEIRPYNFFFKLHYEDFLYMIYCNCAISYQTCEKKKKEKNF